MKPSCKLIGLYGDKQFFIETVANALNENDAKTFKEKAASTKTDKEFTKLVNSYVEII